MTQRARALKCLMEQNRCDKIIAKTNIRLFWTAIYNPFLLPPYTFMMKAFVFFKGNDF